MYGLSFSLINSHCLLLGLFVGSNCDHEKKSDCPDNAHCENLNVEHKCCKHYLNL